MRSRAPWNARIEPGGSVRCYCKRLLHPGCCEGPHQFAGLRVELGLPLGFEDVVAVGG